MTGINRDDARLIYEHTRYLRLLSRSESTIYARSRILARVSVAIRPTRLHAATVPELYAWREGLRVCDGSVQSYVGHLRDFYAWLVAERLRPDNPAAVLPMPPRGRRLPRPIATEDLAYAVANAPARIRPWLVLAAWCGLRAKEIALLRRECVLDTAAPPLLIVALDATKGRRKERAVPLHPFPLGELRALPMPRHGWLFTRRDGQPGPNHPWTLSHIANEYLHGLGVAASIHQLRHWFGTETYRNTRDLRVVQELLGHASPQSTAGYAAVCQADAVAAVGALPEFRAALRPVR